MVFIYFLILIPLCAIITINIFLAVLVIALNNTEKTEEGEKPNHEKEGKVYQSMVDDLSHPDTPIRQKCLQIVRSSTTTTTKPRAAAHNALNSPHTHTPSLPPSYRTRTGAHADNRPLHHRLHTNQHDHYDVQDLPSAG